MTQEKVEFSAGKTDFYKVSKVSIIDLEKTTVLTILGGTTISSADI